MAGRIWKRNILRGKEKGGEEKKSKRTGTREKGKYRQNRKIEGPGGNGKERS